MPDFTLPAASSSAPRGHQALLCVVCLLWPLLSSCSKPETSANAPTSILRLSQRNEPATLDPHLATLPDEFFIIRALSEGLVTPHPDGGVPLPAMAERWATSPDGLTWTFHLRAAQWSNGDPVTAGDFVYSIRRAQHPATLAPQARHFSAVRQLRASDPRTLELVLQQPNPDFLALVASGPWIPVHPATVEKLGSAWTRPGAFVGNGPFILTAWSPHQRIAVQRNPGYWDASAVKLDAIHFLAFDSGDTEERAFRAGQLDVTMSVPASKLDPYRAAQPAVLQTVPLHETRYLALNTTRVPLNDVRVRHALTLALDRQVLVDKVLKGGQQPARTFVPPGLGLLPSAAPQDGLVEDAALARQRLAAAGFPGGKGFPKLELSTWGATPTVLEAIQQRWRDGLGIEVALVQREARTHLAALAAGDFDLGFVTAIPDYDSPADLLARFTTGNPNNYPRWSNGAYDQLVASGDWPSAESFLLSGSAVIPLYFNTKNYLLRPAVHGWREDALWTRYYKHVSLHEP